MKDNHTSSEFPEILRAEREPIEDSLDALGKKYGLESLKSLVLTYAEKLEAISKLNMDLSELDHNSEEDYNRLVKKIMHSTQDYYTFIGKLPEDVRHFFLLVAGTAEGKGNIQDLSDLVGEDLFFDPSPLLSAHAIRPENYTMQMDAITGHLASLGEQTRLKVGRRSGQPVHTTVTLDIPAHMRIEGGGTLSVYDKSILNGVTSLIESGNTVFSVPMLYHAMTGRQNPTVDEGLHEEITVKLEKMRRMMLSIDLSEENEVHTYIGQDGEENKVTDVKLEGYLLPLNKVSGLINGKPAELYQVLQHPPLYTYSKMKRQLASVNISLLGAPVNNNATTIPLKTYLLQRIEMMKNEKNKITRQNILYESIYKELGAQDAGKTKKMRIRTYTTTILAYLVQQGYIESYVEYKQGRSIAGVNIYL